MKEMTVKQFAGYTGMDKVMAAGFLTGCVHLRNIKKVGSVERPGERGRRSVLFGIPASIRIDLNKLDLPFPREVRVKKSKDAPVAAVPPANAADATVPPVAPVQDAAPVVEPVAAVEQATEQATEPVAAVESAPVSDAAPVQDAAPASED